MHVRFAHAAISKTRVGGARLGDVVAYAVGPADGTRVGGGSRADRFVPTFAPFYTEKQNQALSAFGFRAHATSRCEAVAAKSIRETFARKGVILCEEAFFSITWAAVQAILEIKAKILAGDVVRNGILADSAVKTGWLCVLKRVVWARRERRAQASFVLYGEERWRAPVALYDVEDGARAALGVVKS
jgi:hypothetical protein